MDKSLDLGEFQVTAGSMWGCYREVIAFAVAQGPLHPGIEVFTVHAEIQGERTSISVNKDGTLESKEEVKQLMASWIEEAKGE